MHTPRPYGISLAGRLCLGIVIFATGCDRAVAPDDSRIPELDSVASHSQAFQSEYATRLARARQHPDNPDAVAALALLYHANNAYEQAARLYERLIEAQPDDGRWPYRLSRIRQDYGDMEGAVALLDLVHKASPAYALAYWRRGELLIKSGQLEQAEAAFRQCLQLEPGHPYAWLSLGRMALESNSWETARDHLEKATRSDPGLASAYMLLVPVYHALGLPAAADEARDRGRQYQRFAEPEDPWLDEVNEHCFDVYKLQVLAATCSAVSRYDKAVHYYGKALAVDPADPSTLLDLGSLYLQTGRPGLGLPYVRKSLLHNPDHPEAHAALIRQLLKESSPQATREAIEAGLRACPGSAILHDLAGQFHAGQGRLAAAESAFRKALEIDPSSAGFTASLAALYWDAERLPEAAAAYERVLQLIPMDTAARVNVSRIYINLDDLEKAREHIDKLVGLDPGAPAHRDLLAGWHVNMGNRHFVAEEFPAAEAAYRESLKANPLSQDALTNLVILLLVRNRAPEAVDMMVSFIDAHPSAFFAYQLVADVLLETNQPRAARQWLDKGVGAARENGNDEAAQQLSQALDALNGR